MTQLVEIKPNIWIYTIDTGEFIVRCALILGRSRALVWDTMTHPRDMQQILPLIGDRELTVVYSHADWDHIWGTAGLIKPHRLVIGHAECLKRFMGEVPQTLKERKTAEPKTWEEVKLVAPSITFNDDLVIDLGEFTLAIHSLPGHTRDSVVGFIPEIGYLLAGDAVETPFPVINHDSPVQKWIEGLEKWGQDTRVKQVVPAHGETGSREIISRNAEYLSSLLSGKDINTPARLDPFYAKTHEDNLKIIASMQADAG